MVNILDQQHGKNAGSLGGSSIVNTLQSRCATLRRIRPGRVTCAPGRFGSESGRGWKANARFDPIRFRHGKRHRRHRKLSGRFHQRIPPDRHRRSEFRGRPNQGYPAERDSKYTAADHGAGRPDPGEPGSSRPAQAEPDGPDGSRRCPGVVAPAAGGLHEQPVCVSMKIGTAQST